MGNIPQKPLTELPIHPFKTKMSIAIVVIATPEIYEYTKYTIPLIEEWCKRHGYSFFLITKNLIPELPINFTKIEAMLEIIDKSVNIFGKKFDSQKPMFQEGDIFGKKFDSQKPMFQEGDIFGKKFDYVMHIDADAPIINLDYPIEYIIQSYMKLPIVALFSEDCFNLTDCSQPGQQNSGVFIVKNSVMGKAFLKEWKSAALSGPCKRYVNTFPNCQLVLWNCVTPKFAMFIKTLPYNVLNGRDGLLVNHLMKSSGIQRNRVAKDLHSTLLTNSRTGVYN